MSDATVAFNPYDPANLADPYPMFAQLREHEPVHTTPFGIYFVSRYDDVVRLLRDPSMSVEIENATPTLLDAMRDSVLGENQNRRRNQSMLDRDPPDHTRLRRLVSRAFTPKRIGELRGRIQELVDAKLDTAAAAGGMDLVADLAFPLPFDVISEMLGLPDTDRDQIREWSGIVVRGLEPVADPDLIRAIEAAGNNLADHITEVITWKRENPDDRILTQLIAAEESGDVLSDEELVGQVLLLFVAGHETTVNLIGNGTLALLRNPDQLALLRDEPDLIVDAVEELLRFDAPVQMTRRITMKDLEMHGTTIPSGSFTVLALASANRDEEHFGPTAAALDLRRADATDHVSFGGTVHYCLGAALARMEAQVAIGSLVARFPGLAATGDPEYNGRINLRGLERLELSLGQT